MFDKSHNPTVPSSESGAYRQVVPKYHLDLNPSYENVSRTNGWNQWPHWISERPRGDRSR